MINPNEAPLGYIAADAAGKGCGKCDYRDHCESPEASSCLIDSRADKSLVLYKLAPVPEPATLKILPDSELVKMANAMESHDATTKETTEERMRRLARNKKAQQFIIDSLGGTP